VGTDASGDLVENDAPVDGSKYTRQNGGWSEITETGGDFITVDYSGAAAWGYTTVGGGFVNGLNIASMSNPSTGVFEYTFSTPMPSSQYSVQATAYAPSTEVIANWSATSATGFTLSLRSADGSPVNTAHTFTVHATNALPPSKGTGADAWVTVLDTGVRTGEYNISNSVRADTGLYDITFSTPMPNDNYSVIATPITAGSVFCGVSNKTTTGFRINVNSLSGDPINRSFQVVVHATTAALPNTILKEDLLYSDGRQPVTGGIKFETSSVADPDTLDDYEEGTWVPGLSSTTIGTGVFTPSANNGGFYTKIGKRVFFTFNLSGTWSAGTAIGSAELTGLPFVNPPIGQRPGNSAYSSVTVAYQTSITLGAGYILTGGMVQPAGSVMRFYAQDNTTTNTVPIAAFGASVNVHGNGSYEVA